MSLHEALYAHGAISKKADVICEAAEDLKIARRDWKKALGLPDDAVKYDDPADAVISVRDVWHEEFGVYMEVLEQWCLATKASDAGFTSVDDYLAARKNGKAQGGGS
ncbi:MAG TPA: hypothetical protein VFV66_06070 [Nonomuraea sp.]|nr:hypothetical protein [Nonomuraea sp.]